MKQFIKKYIWLIIVSVILTAAIIFGLIKEINWLINITTFFGVIASFIGMFITLRQVHSVEITALETQRAVKDNRDKIRNFLAIADISHLSERIKYTQNKLEREEYEIVCLFLRDIKDSSVRIRFDWQGKKDVNEESVRNLGIITGKITGDIETVTKHLFNLKRLARGEKDVKTTIKPEAICKNLETLREQLIEIETQLKHKKI